MMTSDIHIARLEARYHLPPDPPGSLGVVESRTRLDRLLRQTLDDALPPALARLGVAEHEDVCIRELRIPVRLRLSEGDQPLVAAWSRALADQLADQLAELIDTSSSSVTGGVRPGADVVRYRNPTASLIDFATGVARGDGRRAWAWHQLGHCASATDAVAPLAPLVAALVDACERQPEAIVTVIAALAANDRGGLLADFARRVAAVDGWWRLATAAWTVAGGDPRRLEASLPGVAGTSTSTSTSTSTGSGTRSGTGSGARSGVDQLAGAIVRVARAQPDVFLRDERARRATAALALLEHDPGAAREVGRASGPAGSGTAETPAPVVDKLAAILASLALEDATAADPAADDGQRDARASGVEALPSMLTPHADAPRTTDAKAEPLDRSHDPVSASTEWGGLLFLVHLLGDSPLLDAMTSSASAHHRAHHRSLRWYLYGLARTLLPSAPADDPALLAFAGLGPDAEPPDREHAARADEQRILRVWAATVRSGLRARLAERTGGGRLLTRVCQRRARIVADPGWIEVRLPLASVELPIRRAGLDLDPGWVPWLGVVIKLIYSAEVMP